MLIVFRTAAVLFFACAVVLQSDYFFAFLPCTAVIISAVYGFRGAVISDVLKRNIVIVSFSIFFAGFAVISGYISGDVRYKDPIVLALKIILVFNIVFGGMRWIGRNGYLYLLNRVPGMRLRLFFLLLGNNMLRMMRNNREIVRQIRSRVALTGKNRFIIARYYFQNMLFKELYSMRHSHGAMVLRLGDSLEWHEYEAENDVFDYILLSGMWVYSAASILLQSL